MPLCVDPPFLPASSIASATILTATITITNHHLAKHRSRPSGRGDRRERHEPPDVRLPGRTRRGVHAAPRRRCRPFRIHVQELDPAALRGLRGMFPGTEACSNGFMLCGGAQTADGTFSAINSRLSVMGSAFEESSSWCGLGLPPPPVSPHERNADAVLPGAWGVVGRRRNAGVAAVLGLRGRPPACPRSLEDNENKCSRPNELFPSVMCSRHPLPPDALNRPEHALVTTPFFLLAFYSRSREDHEAAAGQGRLHRHQDRGRGHAA